MTNSSHTCDAAFHWLLAFADGSTLDERDGDAHRSWPVELAKTAAQLVLLPNKAGRPPVVVMPQNGHVVNFFRRQPIMLGPPEAPDSMQIKLDKITIVGLEQEYGNGHYLFVYHDGSLVLSDNLNAVT